ncbi:MAG TPA: hypothetical protein VFB72_21130 [Verrucomicrobiae bacterium]|nr:hypothetical protein [Verrucomicrobiae bacterium]
MTPVQQLLAKGFSASLSQRGVLVSLQPDGETLMVLIEATAPQNEKHPVNQATRTASKLYALRSDVEALKATVGIGTIFRSADNTKSYRVANIQDNPISVKLIYGCETSDVPA